MHTHICISTEETPIILKSVQSEPLIYAALLHRWEIRGRFIPRRVVQNISDDHMSEWYNPHVFSPHEEWNRLYDVNHKLDE